MRTFLFLFIPMLFSIPVSVSASFVSDVETAVAVYSTNTARGVEKLLEVYQSGQADLQAFKSVLYERQSYQLYSELLGRIPQNRETASEVLQMNLILGRTGLFSSDLSNYLKYETAVSAADKYADLIVKNPSCLDALKAGYQPGLFLVLKNSYIRLKRFTQFDAFLAKTGTNAGIPPQEIRNYIRESWSFKQRSVKGILSSFGLEKDPEMTVFSAVSAFSSGDYAGTLEYYSALQPELQKKETHFKALQIDLPYLFFYSLFRQARYRDAVQNIGRFYFPDQNDAAELRFLCYLGLDDMKNAAREINSMRENSKAYFYAGIAVILDNPTNGIEYFERYLQELDESQKYLPGSMLIYYAAYKEPQKVPLLMASIKSSLLYRETPPVKGLALSYPFAFDPSAARQRLPDAGTSDLKAFLSGYMKYALALSKKGSGDDAGAKKILHDLIRSTNSSPLVRSMAIYQARDRE